MLALAFLALITVEGRVVDAVTQQPVGEARVVLLRDGQSYTSGTWDLPVTEQYAADARVISVRTNELGAFRFEIDAPAKFRLFVSKDGYVRDNQSRFDLNEDRKDLAIRLVPEAVISGRVIDVETQKPVPGFAVVAHSYRPSGGGRVLIFAGTRGKTDEEGRYRVASLPPGEYLLEFSPPAGASFEQPKPVEDFGADVRLAYGKSWYPGVISVDEAAPVHVLAGGRADGVDFKVARRRMAALRGVVGAAAEAGEIRLMLVAVQSAVNSGSLRVVARGMAKAGETFEVENLAPGDYFLGAVGPGPGEDRQAAYRVLRVEDRNVDVGELVLQRGLDVKGRVVVEDADPPPSLEGMRVSLEPPMRISLDEESAAVDGSTGEFVLRNYQAEPYMVRALRAPKGFAEREVRYNGTALVHGLVELDRTAARQELEVVLAPANSALEVTVTDGSRPLEKAAVLYFQEPLTTENLHRMRPSVTGAEGRVSIPGLLPGKYRVLAFPAGAAWANDPLLGQRLSSAQEVNVDANTTATIQIRAVMQ
jgi:hypothetical protein